MNEEKLRTFLRYLGQGHLMKEWNIWPKFLQGSFLRQMEKIPKNLYQNQMQVISEQSRKIHNSLTPPVEDQPLGSEAEVTEAVKRGLVATVIIAGGQGTRLGHVGPKGTFVLPRSNRTLFAIILDKCRKLSWQCGKNVPLAIMTSEHNDAQTKEHLKKNQFYGLQADQIDFIVQPVNPFMDSQCRWFLESLGRLAQGPGGNGDLFSCGEKLWHKWQQEGIQAIQVVPIENVLAQPWDKDLLHQILVQKKDLAVLATKKKTQEEKVGAIGVRHGRLHVHEYHFAPQNHLHHAYVGIFACSVQFARQCQKNELPWYAAPKKEACLFKEQFGWVQKQIDAWKFEKFIFDAFPFALDFSMIVKQREKIFAPLKSKHGNQGIYQAENMMIKHGR
jgi:UDP-N-acetylglucosamine/UDP-N-acetylgalactosamine diphosphorylase